MREYNRNYYHNNKDRVLASRRKCFDAIKNAEYQVNHWTKKLKELREQQV